MVEPQTAAVAHLECVDKIYKLPVVEMACNQSVGMYKKMKEANGVLEWTLSTAEATILKAVEQAAPIAKKLEQPIHAVDQTLCKAIAIVEEKLPFVKEPPSSVYDAAKGFVHHVFSPMGTFSAVKDYGTEKARTYTGMGVNKANELLATQYGTVALSGFETTAALAEKYLDHYFPATEQELQGESEPSAVQGGDKVMSTVHTVGRLSNKFSRRVYNILSSNVKKLDYDSVQLYIKSVATIMHLTDYLNILNENLRVTTSSNQTENTEEKSSSHAQNTEEKKTAA